MEKNIIYLEFIGPPGAGKTTIAKKTKKELQKRGYKCISKRDFNKKKILDKMLLVFYLLFFINLSVLQFLTIKKQKNTLNTKTKRKLKFILYYLFAKKSIYNFSKKKKKLVILYDDSIFQKLCNFVFLEIISVEDATKIARGMLFPESLLVVVGLDSQESIKRQIERKRRVSHLIKSKEIKKFSIIMHNFKKGIFDKTDNRFFVIDGSKPVNKNVFLILKKINAIK